MGNYVFSTDVLLDELEADAADPSSSHDFGKDVLPRIIDSRRVVAYDFTANVIPGQIEPNTYWRDVGTLGAYFEANLDLKDPMPHLNLYNPQWPIRSVRYHDPAGKIVVGEKGWAGQVHNTLLGAGSVVSGAYVRDTVIGRNVFIGSGAIVEESVVLGHCVIREGARVHRAIIDHGTVLQQGEVVGGDRERDRQRWFVDDETGIVVTGIGTYEDPFVSSVR
jgi:glucose-1-phosphate adenylyltransferase